MVTGECFVGLFMFWIIKVEGELLSEVEFERSV